MNIKKFGKRLNKINMLFESIKEDGTASAIEKDLLLSYMRDAYEYVHESEASSTPAPKSNAKKFVEPEHHVAPPIATPSPSVIQQIVSEEVAPTPAPEPVAPTPQPSTEIETPVVEVNPKLDAVFKKAEVTELSDKLGMSPIKDMNKAMGINERIFTITELFGGDTAIFNSVLDTINDCKSYEEARTYLITGIAKDQNWAAEERIKKVEHFVKLVKRRFV